MSFFLEAFLSSSRLATLEPRKFRLYERNSAATTSSACPTNWSFGFSARPQRISLVDFDMPFGRTVGFICLLIIAGFFGGIAVLLQYH